MLRTKPLKCRDFLSALAVIHRVSSARSARNRRISVEVASRFGKGTQIGKTCEKPFIYHNRTGYRTSPIETSPESYLSSWH